MANGAADLRNRDRVHHSAMSTRTDPSPSRDSAPPLDALWQPRVLLWVLLAGEGLALVLALAPGRGAGRWTYFAMASLFAQWVSLLSLGTIYFARSRLRRLRPQQVAWVALGVVLLHTLAVVAVARVALGDAWGGDGLDWSIVSLQVAGIAATVGLLGLAAFRNHWHARRAAVRLKQAELEALQARIRPHFLFNTLNTATALVHGRPEQAERLLLDLADLFRAALAGPREISLADELSLARRYLEIEGLRCGERLRVDWDLPEEIPDLRVPALSIQPLVENAVRHGVERSQRGGRIEIALTVTPTHVIVRIRNPLFLSDQERPISHHVGLSAAQARIEAMTGGLGSVETGRQGEHYVATVRLPRRAPQRPTRGRWR